MSQKLNPDDLVVSSFETDLGPAPEEQAVYDQTPMCPTPQTWCRICPPYEVE